MYSDDATIEPLTIFLNEHKDEVLRFIHDDHDLIIDSDWTNFAELDRVKERIAWSKGDPANRPLYRRQLGLDKDNKPKDMEIYDSYKLDPTPWTPRNYGDPYTEKGLIFLNAVNEPMAVCTHEERTWLYCWGPYDNVFVTVRVLSREEVEQIPRNLTKKQQQIYRDLHNKFACGEVF